MATQKPLCPKGSPGLLQWGHQMVLVKQNSLHPGQEEEQPRRKQVRECAWGCRRGHGTQPGSSAVPRASVTADTKSTRKAG